MAEPAVIDDKERRAVAGALIEYDDDEGVPIYAISSITRLSKPITQQVLILLESHAEVERILPLAADKWAITEYGRKAYRDERFASKMRKCLSCRKDFDSSHAGNRICEKCLNADCVLDSA